MAAVQGADDLAEDAPDELLLAHLVLVLQVADDASQVAVAAVLHVQMQVLARLDVVALEVGDDVGVAQLLEDGQLGLQLLALLLRHLAVADLLAAQDVAIGLALDLADDAKRAMSYAPILISMPFQPETLCLHAPIFSRTSYLSSSGMLAV